MTDQYTRITVPLSKEEFEALRDSAQLDYRHPRDHARFLLRGLLVRSNTKAANASSANTTLPPGTQPAQI